MAYTPKTWTCGETITDAGLNNIEQGIQEALGCCESELPEVTAADNGKVLTVIDGEWDKGEGGSGGLPAVTTDDDGDILTVVDGEWEKAEPGYKCASTSTTLTEETVTTSGSAPYIAADLSYSTPIDVASITATFDGTDYELNKVDLGWGVAYGDYPSGPDFTNYPLAILSAGGTNTIFTETAGTHSIKIVATNETVTTSNCFEKAVKKFGLKYVKDANIVGGVLANDVNSNTVTAQYALAEGVATTASGTASHAEGHMSTASGNNSHVEGDGSTASGNNSHAEGNSTASGINSHAEGANTTSSEFGSHAEGWNSVASGRASHAEGNSTASGDYAHAEGHGTMASGSESHAEGIDTTASGDASHAQNEDTIAQGKGQTAIGTYNIAQGTNDSIATTDYAFIIGNGTSESNRSNAFAIKWDGTFVFANGTEITPAQFAQILALI